MFYKPYISLSLYTLHIFIRPTYLYTSYKSYTRFISYTSYKSNISNMFYKFYTSYMFYTPYKLYTLTCPIRPTYYIILPTYPIRPTNPKRPTNFERPINFIFSTCSKTFIRITCPISYMSNNLYVQNALFYKNCDRRQILGYIKIYHH